MYAYGVWRPEDPQSWLANQTTLVSEYQVQREMLSQK